MTLALSWQATCFRTMLALANELGGAGTVWGPCQGTGKHRVLQWPCWAPSASGSRAAATLRRHQLSADGHYSTCPFRGSHLLCSHPSTAPWVWGSPSPDFCRGRGWGHSPKSLGSLEYSRLKEFAFIHPSIQPFMPQQRFMGVPRSVPGAENSAVNKADNSCPFRTGNLVETEPSVDNTQGCFTRDFHVAPGGLGW